MSATLLTASRFTRKCIYPSWASKFWQSCVTTTYCSFPW